MKFKNGDTLRQLNCLYVSLKYPEVTHYFNTGKLVLPLKPFLHLPDEKRHGKFCNEMLPCYPITVESLRSLHICVFLFLFGNILNS